MSLVVERQLQNFATVELKKRSFAQLRAAYRQRWKIAYCSNDAGKALFVYVAVGSTGIQYGPNRLAQTLLGIGRELLRIQRLKTDDGEGLLRQER